MTSEEKLGLQEPANHQCGNIDDMIDRVNEAEAFTRQALTALDSQTVVQANKETHARLKGFADELEDLRVAIEQVRAWGQDWKNTAKELLDRHEPERLNPSIEWDEDALF